MMLTTELFDGADALFGRARQPIFEVRVAFRVLVERADAECTFHAGHLRRHCTPRLHSYRSAVVGETRAARAEGMRPARVATRARSRTAAITVTGSVA